MSRFTLNPKADAPTSAQARRGADREGEGLDLYPARHQRLLVTHVGKFPLSKNPKVEIPMFNGDGDVLNWIYQTEHLFTIHSTPIED